MVGDDGGWLTAESLVMLCMVEMRSVSGYERVDSIRMLDICDIYQSSEEQTVVKKTSRRGEANPNSETLSCRDD